MKSFLLLTLSMGSVYITAWKRYCDIYVVVSTIELVVIAFELDSSQAEWLGKFLAEIRFVEAISFTISFMSYVSPSYVRCIAL